MQHELGDLLFALVNLARKLGLDAESALRGIDRSLRPPLLAGGRGGPAPAGREVSDLSADEQDRLWEAAKAALSDEELPPSPLLAARRSPLSWSAASPN